MAQAGDIPTEITVEFLSVWRESNKLFGPNCMLTTYKSVNCGWLDGNKYKMLSIND